MSEPVNIAPGSGDLFNLAISVSALGDNTLVSAVAGRAIVVVDYVLDASGGANTVTWKRAGTAISGAMDMVADTPLAPGWNPWGHFKTNKGEALVLNLSAATLVTGHLTYMLIDRGP